MSLLITNAQAVPPPNLPLAPQDYDSRYQEQFNNVLRLYFNRLNSLLGQILATTSPIPVSIGGTNVDAFGRLRVSQPYTLFDSQQRYAGDPQFDTQITNGGTNTATTSYNVNQSTMDMIVTTSGDKVIRQTFRCFPYQPGKGLLVLATFVMDGNANNALTQRVGYYNDDNGVFFQRVDGVYSFVLRSDVTGTPSDARLVTQSQWNGDKLDGTGASGYILDPSKAQILWMDFEWLGVGSVRCGFIINGQYIVCHTFNNANEITTVYMTTAILPIRYEIFTSTNLTATLKQICASVVSEGGYEEYSTGHIARRTTALATINTTFKPLVSIRLAPTGLNAIVVPGRIQVLPTASQNYEVALVKNPTLTSPVWVNLNKAQGTGTVSGTTLTISAMTSGTFKIGQLLQTLNAVTFETASGFPASTYIKAQLTGTTGGVGTYQLSNSFTVAVATPVAALGNVEYDVSATATTLGTIIQTDYVSSSGSGGSQPLIDPAGYNWAFQPGTSIGGTSEIIGIQIRTVSGATTGDAVGSLSFWDLSGG